MDGQVFGRWEIVFDGGGGGAQEGRVVLLNVLPVGGCAEPGEVSVCY